MKILICDSLNQHVYKELETIGDCLDISKSASKDEDLAIPVSYTHLTLPTIPTV